MTGIDGCSADCPLYKVRLYHASSRCSRASRRGAQRPGTLPLLLLDDAHSALRIANFLQIGLLFVMGYRWARYSGANPWRTGVLIALLGVVLVLVSVALGG